MADPTTGECTHKLCFEAFFRLLWKAFLVWYSQEEVLLWLCMLAACRAKVDARASATEVVEDFESLREGLQDIIEKLEEFKAERRKASKLFAFWEECGTMVDLLLQLIKAERTGNWKLSMYCCSHGPLFLCNGQTHQFVLAPSLSL